MKNREMEDNNPSQILRREETSRLTQPASSHEKVNKTSFNKNFQLRHFVKQVRGVKISLIFYSIAAIIGPKLFRNPKNISPNKHRNMCDQKSYEQLT